MPRHTLKMFKFTYINIYIYTVCILSISRSNDKFLLIPSNRCTIPNL